VQRHRGRRRARDGRGRYCQLFDVWTVVGPDVLAQIVCFAPGGAPANSSFFATYSASV